MFENYQFYINFLKNFHIIGEILILVKIFESLNV